MENSSKYKYKIGDRVYLKKEKIDAINNANKRNYPYDIIFTIENSEYFPHSLSFVTDCGSSFCFNEDWIKSLVIDKDTLFTNANSFSIDKYVDDLIENPPPPILICDCGAAYTSNPNHHADWCSLNTKKGG